MWQLYIRYDPSKSARPNESCLGLNLQLKKNVELITHHWWCSERNAYGAFFLELESVNMGGPTLIHYPPAVSTANEFVEYAAVGFEKDEQGH